MASSQDRIHDSLLRLLRLDSLCWWTTDECIVWQNNHLVPSNQPDPIDFFHGDFVKVKIALNLDPLDRDDGLHAQLALFQASIATIWRSIGELHQCSPPLVLQPLQLRPPAALRPELDEGARLDLESLRNLAIMEIT